jgi:hypothetical protein
MPDLSSASDVVELYPRQEFTWAHVEAAWRIVLTVGALLVIVLAIVAFILYAFRFLESWRNTPPPPTSIIPEQPDGRRR